VAPGLPVILVRNTIWVSHRQKEVIWISGGRRLYYAHFPGLRAEPFVEFYERIGEEATSRPRFAREETDERLGLRDAGGGGFVLSIVQAVLVKTFDQSIPEVTDFVRLQLSKPLGMPLVTKPKPLIDANDICSFWPGERAPTVKVRQTRKLCSYFQGRQC
jgi:hypothetical protein